MECLHPHCPLGNGAQNWATVAGDPYIVKRRNDHGPLLAFLNNLPVGVGIRVLVPQLPNALVNRLLEKCPCLFSQLNIRPTARGIVHLSEISIGDPINVNNVVAAYNVSHPNNENFTHPPVNGGRPSGGDVMEELCSETLTNAGIPLMNINPDRTVNWRMPGHINMNKGRMRELKAFGDILIPCAPTNLIISVKSESARERLLYSANMIEGIGFGFFNQPDEFWSELRIKMYKRMGFTAIYMPDVTHTQIITHLQHNGRNTPLNINGTDLYRPISQFGQDMLIVVGNSTLNL